MRIVFFLLLVTPPCFGQTYDQKWLEALNARGKAVRPGGIYLVDQGKCPPTITEVVHLLQRVEPNGLEDWSKQIPLRMSTTQLWLGNLCVKESVGPKTSRLSHANLRLNIRSAVAEDLTDPFDCLEILNRPLLGYELNRTAELRIRAWRRSLSSAILRARNDAAIRVAMCTGTDTGEASLFIDSWIKPQSAVSVASTALAGTNITKQFVHSEERIVTTGKRHFLIVPKKLTLRVRLVEILSEPSVVNRDRVVFSVGRSFSLKIPSINTTNWRQVSLAPTNEAMRSGNSSGNVDVEWTGGITSLGAANQH